MSEIREADPAVINGDDVHVWYVDVDCDECPIEEVR